MTDKGGISAEMVTVSALRLAQVKLKQAQLKVIADNKDFIISKGFDADDIASKIESRAENIAVSNGNASFMMTIPRKLRYLDMKRICGVPIYNRPVWGIFFGSQDSVKTQIASQMSEQLLEEMAAAIRGKEVRD